MHLLRFTLLTLATIENTSPDVASGISNPTTAQNNFIGIGGIVATLFATAITCYVTWILTMKNMKQLKLAYRYQIFSIFSKAISDNSQINFSDWQIKYKGKILRNPCLLVVDIINTGNSSIINPPITIEVDKHIVMSPGYFEKIPSGYEDLWNFQQTNCSNSYALSLQHINPKQIVSVRFFLDDFPKKALDFKCPMPDIQLTKMTSNVNSKSIRTKRINLNRIFSILFTFFATGLLINFDFFYASLSYYIWDYGLEGYLDALEIMIYIIATLFLTIVVNIFGAKKLDNYLLMHPHEFSHMQIMAIVLYFILLALIIPNIISNFGIQILFAVFSAILFALFVHISVLKRDNFL